MSTQVEPFLTTLSVHRLCQRCGGRVPHRRIHETHATFDTTLTKESFRRGRALKVGDDDLHLGAHGGDVVLSESTQHGTLFRLSLPRVGAAEVEARRVPVVGVVASPAERAHSR